MVDLELGCGVLLSRWWIFLVVNLVVLFRLAAVVISDNNAILGFGGGLVVVANCGFVNSCGSKPSSVIF